MGTHRHTHRHTHTHTCESNQSFHEIKKIHQIKLNIINYRIALNFGGAKLWQIGFLSPNITLQNSPNYA